MPTRHAARKQHSERQTHEGGGPRLACGGRAEPENPSELAVIVLGGLGSECCRPLCSRGHRTQIREASMGQEPWWEAMLGSALTHQVCTGRKHPLNLCRHGRGGLRSVALLERVADSDDHKAQTPHGVRREAHLGRLPSRPRGREQHLDGSEPAAERRPRRGDGPTSLVLTRHSLSTTHPPYLSR
jgi:hypothetical protein